MTVLTPVQVRFPIVLNNPLIQIAPNKPLTGKLQIPQHWQVDLGERDGTRTHDLLIKSQLLA